MTLKARRRKKIIKTNMQIHEIENGKSIKKINRSKS